MLKEIKDWGKIIKRTNKKAVEIKNLPEYFLDLMDSDLYYKCCDKKKINLTLDNIKNMKKTLLVEKEGFENRNRILKEIISDAPETDHDCTKILKSWKYFEKPESEEDLKKLYHRLNEAVFNKDEVDKITNVLNSDRKSGLSDQDIEKKLDDDLIKICPELEKLYEALTEEIELGNYGVEGSINEIKASKLHKIALDYFDRNQNEYKLINKTLIQKERLYQFSRERRRMFIRNFLQEYLQDHPAMRNKKIKTAKEALHNRYNKINRLT